MSDTAASKASFKLDLIETVNADPAMEASDVKLIAAYAAVMGWPKREAWLSSSRARAMTGLSERQVSNSRSRLAGQNKARRTYLSEIRKDGLTTVFRIENPWREDCRQHVAIMTEQFREGQKERQAERRRVVRVPATVADTETDCPRNECSNVPATVAGNIPSYTPQDIALKKGEPIKVSSVPSYEEIEDDPHLPYPIPHSEQELATMLSSLFDGCSLSPAIMAAMRKMLMAGKLTPAIVEEQRRFAS